MKLRQENGWTFGTDGYDGRFGGAYPDGRVNLHYWGGECGAVLASRKMKFSTYRKAVRALRHHLMGYTV